MEGGVGAGPHRSAAPHGAHGGRPGCAVLCWAVLCRAAGWGRQLCPVRCCSVLPGAARCCSVLPGAARCCPVLPGAARCYPVLLGAARCSAAALHAYF